MLTPLVFASVIGAGWHRLWHERAGQDQILFQPRKPTYRFEAARGFSDEFGPNQEFWLHECRHSPPLPPTSSSPPPPSDPAETATAADDASSFPRATVAVPVATPNDNNDDGGDQSTSAKRAPPKTADDVRADEKKTMAAEQVATTSPPTSTVSTLVSKWLAPSLLLSSPLPPSSPTDTLAPSGGSATPSSAPPPQLPPPRSPSSFLSWIFQLAPEASSSLPTPAPQASTQPQAAHARLLIVFMHGTAGNIGTARTQMLRLVDIVRQRATTTALDLVVVAPEYPGYGPETFYEVQPTEETAKRAVWNTVKRLAARYPAHRLVLVGYSIGAAFASWLATQCAPPPSPMAPPRKASSLQTSFPSSSSSSSSSASSGSPSTVDVVSSGPISAPASPPSSPAPPTETSRSAARSHADTSSPNATAAAAGRATLDEDEGKIRAERATDGTTAASFESATRLDDNKGVAASVAAADHVGLGSGADDRIRKTRNDERAAAVWTEHTSDHARTFFAPLWVAARCGVTDAGPTSPAATDDRDRVVAPSHSVCVRALTDVSEALRPVTRLTRKLRHSRLAAAPATAAATATAASVAAPPPAPPVSTPAPARAAQTRSLATRCPTVHGLMLVSGFSSARALFRDFGAERFTAANAFDSARNVAQLAPSVPLFLVHGVRDTLIDATHSRAMYDASRSVNKRLVLQRNRDHLDVRFLDHLARFVLSLPA